MTRRESLFLQLRNYSAVARIEGVDPATIRKQMYKVKDPDVQLFVKQRRKYKKFKQCVMCYRPFEGKVKLASKGQYWACYRYFRASPFKRVKRRILN